MIQVKGLVMTGMGGGGGGGLHKMGKSRVQNFLRPPPPTG